MSDNTRDTCYGLSWDGLPAATTGRDIRRVRLEQLGLILVPNSLKPTELIELVLLNSKQVRNAFFTFMKDAGRYSLLEMHTLLDIEGVLPPMPKVYDSNSVQYFPHLHQAQTGTTRPIIDKYAPEDEDRLGQHWSDGVRVCGSVPLDAEVDPQDVMSNACYEFNKTISKAIPSQATKVAQMARGLDNVRFDDVWGNFYYISDELKTDAIYLLLQVLLHDWFAVATTAIPAALEEKQMARVALRFYGESAYTDLFHELRGHVRDDAVYRGGFDDETFATLLHIQDDPEAHTIRVMPAQLFKLEFDRLWAYSPIRAQIGRVVAAIWEETSRDISEDGRGGCDVAGVVQSLFYALSTDSNFVMGNPAIRDDEDGEQQEYGRERPVMPSEFAGTSYRLIDAVRVALQDVAHSISGGSEIIAEFYRIAYPKQRCAIHQCILWHGILNWFHIDRVPAPDMYSTHPNVLATPVTPLSAADDYEDEPGSSVGVIRQTVEEGEAESSVFASSIDETSYISEFRPGGGLSSSSEGGDSGNAGNADITGITGYTGNTGNTGNVRICFRSGDDEEDLTPAPASPGARVRLVAPSPERYDSFRQRPASNSGSGDNNGDEDDMHSAWLDAHEPTLVHPRVATLNWNVRPNQYYLSPAVEFNRDRVLDREAYLHGAGPFLYVRASGEDDNITLPPHLVDSRRRSGNADGIISRELEVEEVAPRDDEGQCHTAVEYQERIVNQMLVAFPAAPPLREPPAVCSDFVEQAILAIMRSVELQPAYAALEEHMEVFKSHLEITCLNHSLSYGLLAHSVAEYGAVIGKDMRLAIVADNRVPVLGWCSGARTPPSAETVMIWVYHDFTPRLVGDTTWVQTFRALKPVRSLVGHGRDSHYWLGVRQRVYESWGI